jgi:toxin ParE1/3/4
MKLLFTHSAQRDLMRLRDFIAENNPQAASQVSRRLVASVRRLTDQPEMGIEVEGLPVTQDLITGDYIVRYAVLEDEIYILRIWHGKEDR